MLLDVAQHLRELFAEKRRDDGGRRLVGPETVSVGRAGYTGFQQSVMPKDCHKCTDNERHEAQVVRRSSSWRHEKQAGVRA